MANAVIIQNGIVVDPVKGTQEKKEIAIKNGVFVSVEEAQAEKNVTFIDANGSFVAPGFIDMHVHVFELGAVIGIDPDRVGVNQGVTTVVDAGSVGYEDYPAFKKNIIEKSKTDVLAFLNISVKGLVHGLSELANLDHLMTLEQWREINALEANIVGLKARMSGSVVKDSGIKPLEHARMVADDTETPIMVHIGNPPPNLEEIFPLLVNGDIVTHAFHGKDHGVLDEKGLLIPDAQAALERGVLFDVGHGTASFSFETITKYRQSYEFPFTISTDVYDKNIDKPVGSLMLTMTKLMEIGYSFMEVIQSVTIRAAEALQTPHLGTLVHGARGDVTIFNLVSEPTDLFDSDGKTMRAEQVLKPYMTMREGKVVYQSE